ncbi:MAG: LysR family transcriptional regulator [Gammaproteobacteria bacterium]|nr:LysR family transcriptional regulator [Gammaproteobacteria bacterium]
MIERNHLTILREIERQGSLTGAAQALCLTQSALSHAINKLVQQIGTEVWIKEGRNLQFTQAGNYLLSLANRLLPQLKHAEEVIEQIASGQRGVLRIGIECHPCYEWLLNIVAPYLRQWPDVDVDVKQQFQFGGIGALFSHDIDVLVTPDPLNKPDLIFVPVFDYEQVLVVRKGHVLADLSYVEPEQVAEQTLITYPIETERLDVYSLFLLPANCRPKKRKTIETTDILLQMVAAGRGVAALPRWLVEEYATKLPIQAVKLGKKGIAKKIFLGIRHRDADTDYLTSFLETARQAGG